MTYLTYSLLTDYLINPLIKHSLHDYSLGLRIFTIVEFCAISYYFSKIINLQHSKSIFIGTITLFLILSIQDFISNKNFVFDSIPTAISAVILIVYSIVFFYAQLRQNNSSFLYDLPEFWSTVGVLIYFSGTLFLFIFSQKYFDNSDFKILFNSFLSFFSVVRSVLWSISIQINNK